MTDPSEKQLKTKYFNRKGLKNLILVNSTYIVTFVIVVLVLWVFIPQLSNLKESIKAAQDANKVMLVAALLVFILGFPIVAYKYTVIAPSKIKYWLTLQVQIASAFISKLLPMSIGSLTVNTYYLTFATKSVAKAGSTMALNAATSSTAFVFIIAFALIGNFHTINHVASTTKNIKWSLVVFIFLIIGFILWRVIHSKKFLDRIRKGSMELWQNFKNYKNEPLKVVGGILFNGLGSLTGITTLYLCCKATGLDVTFSQAILSYTLGNIVGGLVPTPGGLGGAEAGLYGGLVFFGYNPDLALISVLIYRLISYWLPIIPGYIMYHHLRKSTLADFHIRKKNPEPAS
jgi:undecaprenyl-diphosphatase